MLSGEVQLVFNTTEGAQAIADSFSLRRTALTNAIPYYTTVAGARAAVQAIAALRAGSLKSRPLNPTFEGSFAAAAFAADLFDQPRMANLSSHEQDSDDGRRATTGSRRS